MKEKGWKRKEIEGKWDRNREKIGCVFMRIGLIYIQFDRANCLIDIKCNAIV